MKIAVITEHKDTFTNPTLLVMFEKLQVLGISVALITNEQNFQPPGHLLNLEIWDIPDPLKIVPRRPNLILKIIVDYYRCFKRIKREKIRHLLAVDHSGLIVAGRLRQFSTLLKIHYISFEIFFFSELANQPVAMRIKENELKYCKMAVSILIQDEIRKTSLVRENKIPPQFKNWFYVPVAPLFSTINASRQNIRQKLGIRESDFVFVHTGSVANWSGMQIIANAIRLGLPQNFKILVHNRFEFNSEIPIQAELIELNEACNELILHHADFSFYELCGFISAFDCGLAFYKSELGDPYIGKNIEEIGLASGKFSTYMMLDKPVITTYDNIYEKLSKTYNIIRIISDEFDFINLILNRDLFFNTGDGYKLYQEILDPEPKLNNYLDFVLKA